jgi:hypothetical protein
MSDAVKDGVPDLDTMILETLEEGGYAVSGGRELFMEVVDKSTGLYWMSAAAVTQADFDALHVEEPLAKAGCALASMDRAAFQSSPGSVNSTVLERVIDGRSFINVAAVKEMAPPSLPDGPAEVFVDKTHIIGFEAGRSVVVLSLPEGDFVELVGDDSGDSSLTLPAGGELITIELTQPWLVILPTPARAFFWFGDGMRSFQGPVKLPE